MTPAPIQARSLVHAYGHDPVLSIPELALSPGRYHLSGANGAGKTTLLRILATLLRPSEGTVRVAGHDLPDQAAQARAHLGFAGHEASLHASLPARQALGLHANLHRLEEDRVAQALDAWGLGHVAQRRVASLSHGQRRRLDLARALLHRPDVLLLDEPTAGLDEEARATLDERLSEAEPDVVLAASPDRPPVRVDETVHLREGRLEGSP